MAAPIPSDKIDMEARRRATRILHERFMEIAEKIMRGEPPELKIPKRTLANVRFDPERGILVMGEGYITREFLNMAEARRFMQTLLMAAIIYQALVENEYPTIRDLYYRGKHTIVYRDLKGRLRQENTWDEQSESDAAIRDVEVFTGLLREDMLILSKEKGKVVGRMRIRSGDDVIDLSRLGHGAYAIESTPDLIEFVDVDAEFVLVVEKDAVFQQLHRVKFWDKYKAILVTGAGQPDRATRRFVRRLNEELGLPVYILTDSIPADELVILRDPSLGTVMGGVEDLLSTYFTGGEREWAVVEGLEVPALNPATGKITWSPVGYIYRHYIEDTILKMEIENRGTVRVTKAHSLFLYRNGRITVAPASSIKPGDLIVVASKLPPLGDLGVSLSRTLERIETNGDRYHLAFNNTLEAKALFNKLLSTGLHPTVDEGSGETLISLDHLPLQLSAAAGGSPVGSGVRLTPKTLVSGHRGWGDIEFARVLSVEEEDYQGYVYDFMVPEGNSFVGGYGIVYHNSDPYGFYIYSVYKVGSIQLSYESERLATPKARFLGVSMTDIFGGPGKKPWLSERERKNFIIRATDRDIKRARELLSYSWFQTKKWKRELKIFLKKKAKLEIEALASKGLKFLAFEYIPRKIETGDWIE